MDNSNKSVDLIIPVYKPDVNFLSVIKKMDKQHHKLNKIILIHSLDKDDKNPGETESIMRKITTLKREGIVEIHDIDKKDFNHGLTRNLGVSFSQADYVMFMTQDAFPADAYLVDELLRPFEDKGVAVTYGRQLPKKGCGYLERYVRRFNYPPQSKVKSKKDIETMGIKALFCSDVCAMYDRKVFMELGEFKETDFNEDQFFAHEVLMSGRKIGYSCEAKVFHSHNYTYIQQFKRNYLVGRSQELNKEIFEGIKSENEGIRLIKSATSHMIRHGKWYMIPDLILCSGFKYLGYKAGKISVALGK